MTKNRSLASKQTLASDARGSIFVEYIILVSFVALLMISIFGPRVGSAMATEYTSQRAVLYSATP